MVIRVDVNSPVDGVGGSRSAAAFSSKCEHCGEMGETEDQETNKGYPQLRSMDRQYVDCCALKRASC